MQELKLRVAGHKPPSTQLPCPPETEVERIHHQQVLHCHGASITEVKLCNTAATHGLLYSSSCAVGVTHSRALHEGRGSTHLPLSNPAALLLMSCN